MIFYCDGAANPNPGPCAIGVAMIDESGTTLATISRCLGEGTNNVTEVAAVEAAIDLAREHGVELPDIRTDSEWTTKAVSGEYSVANARLAPMVRRVRAKLGAARGTLRWIAREENMLADTLSKRPLLKSIYYVPTAEVIAQAIASLQHLVDDHDVRTATEFAIAHLEMEPEVVSDMLHALRLGRTTYSTMDTESAHFRAGLLHGSAAVAQMEAALVSRSAATRLKALRWAARGFAPVLVFGKLTIEKAATTPYRRRAPGDVPNRR